MVEYRLAPASGYNLVSRPAIEATDHHTVTVKTIEQWRGLRFARSIGPIALEVRINMAGNVIVPAFDRLNSSQISDSVPQGNYHRVLAQHVFPVVDSYSQFERAVLLRDCHVMTPG